MSERLDPWKQPNLNLTRRIFPEFDTADDVAVFQTRLPRVESDPVIGTEVVELVANLSGCASYRPPPDCSQNICFHRK